MSSDVVCEVRLRSDQGLGAAELRLMRTLIEEVCDEAKDMNVTMSSARSGTYVTISGEARKLVNVLRFLCVECSEWRPIPEQGVGSVLRPNSRNQWCTHIAPGSGHGHIYSQYKERTVIFDVVSCSLRDVPKPLPSQHHAGSGQSTPTDGDRWMLDQAIRLALSMSRGSGWSDFGE